jgi:DNA-binding GntR family transcriptional regulator
MNSLDKCYKTLQQNGRGLRAIDLAKELNLNKSTIHRNLSTLQLRGKVEERNGIWYAIQNSQNLNPIKTILDELENLTIKQAELKSQIHFIENYNPENIDPEIEITELEIKIEELERLKNNLITQLKLSTTINT